MADQSESRGSEDQEMERENAQSGSAHPRRHSAQPQRGTGPMPVRRDDPRDQSRGSGTLGTGQHTEAGSNGTSGGQISPQPGMAARIGGKGSARKG